MAGDLYTEEELDLLEKSKNLRIGLVDNLVTHADPTAKNYNSTARVVNELLTSLDKTIHDSANTRLKHQDSQNVGNMADIMAGIFKEIHTQNANAPKRVTVILDDKFLPDDVVPGELSIEQPVLDLKDFESKREE